ncbi:hypothetical protein GCM10020331_075950 [Ectobacillus funiculus]
MGWQVLQKAFANELAEYNVQINAIAPGYVETANTAPIRADKKSAMQKFCHVFLLIAGPLRQI